jgi:hypothetical protein
MKNWKPKVEPPKECKQYLVRDKERYYVASWCKDAHKTEIVYNWFPKNLEFTHWMDIPPG